jgi:hypothetical protein
MTPVLRRTAITLAITLATLGAVAAEREPLTVRPNDGPGLSLRVTDEAAPAGSIVQIKVEVTEAKPISTGRGKIKIKGVSAARQVSVLATDAQAAAANASILLMNPGQDTYGLALMDGEDLTFAVTSPSNLFGTHLDAPILAIAATVPNASAGTRFPIELDANGLGFRDPSGNIYPTEIQNGSVTVSRGAISISDVTPGSSIVPAGGLVRISGVNFTPDTRLQLDEASLAAQRFISSHEIDVVLGQTTNMHGLRIRVRNDEKDNKSECVYFSYERTTSSGASNDPILGRVVPLFAPATYTTATIDLPKVTSGKRRSAGPSRGSSSSATTYGFALQNLQTSTATVTVELLDRSGNPYAINTISIGPDRFLVQEFGEVFGLAAPPSALRIRSNVPIQVLGLTADRSTGSAAALPPH